MRFYGRRVTLHRDGRLRFVGVPSSCPTSHVDVDVDVGVEVDIDGDGDVNVGDPR